MSPRARRDESAAHRHKMASHSAASRLAGRHRRPEPSPAWAERAPWTPDATDATSFGGTFQGNSDMLRLNMELAQIDLDERHIELDVAKEQGAIRRSSFGSRSSQSTARDHARASEDSDERTSSRSLTSSPDDACGRRRRRRPPRPAECTSFTSRGDDRQRHCAYRGRGPVSAAPGSC